METEQKLLNGESEKTDEGYSEKKLAKQSDHGISSKQSQTAISVNVFNKQKKSETIFQAPKDEEI